MTEAEILSAVRHQVADGDDVANQDAKILLRMIERLLRAAEQRQL